MATASSGPERAAALLRLGRACTALSEYPQARRAFEQAAELAAHAADPRLRVAALRDLGSIRRVEGRYDEAQEILGRALALAEQALGAEALEAADVMTDLGIVFKYAGRFDEAEPSTGGRSRSQSATRGPSTPTWPRSITTSAGSSTRAGTTRRRSRSPEHGIEIRERAAVADHPDLAADKAALAAILDGAGKHEEAERLLREALALFEQLFGEAHYEVAVNLNNLAAIHHRRGDEPRARELYERALAIKEKLLGAAHPDLAPTLANLAALHASAGRIAEATACYSRAIAVLDPVVEPDHPTLVACREDRASLL